ncbi:ArnT family glycosyltransferase [Acidobacteriota bacterium]
MFEKYNPGEYHNNPSVFVQMLEKDRVNRIKDKIKCYNNEAKSVIKIKLSKTACALLMLCLCVRVFLFAGIKLKNPSGFFQNDSYGYWKIAENLVNYGTFSQSDEFPLAPDHSRTPVYPILIAAMIKLGFNAYSVIIVQLILSCLTCLLIVWMTYKLSGNYLSGLLAGLMIAVDVPSVVLANCLLTETLFTFLLVLSLSLLAVYLKNYGMFGKRLRLLCASGIIMGTSVLCRPIALFLPIFMVGMILFFFHRINKKIIISITIYSVICLLIIFPWIIRNQVVFGYPFVSTIGYRNMLNYRAAGIYAEKNNISLGNARSILSQKARSTYKGSQNDIVGMTKHQATVGASFILRNPAIYVRNHIKGLSNMLIKPIRSTIDLQLGFSKEGNTLTVWGKGKRDLSISGILSKTSPLTFILLIFQMAIISVLWLACFWGIIKSFIKKDYLTCSIVLTLLIYFCLVSGGPEAYARFRVPLIPFIAIGAGVGLQSIIENIIRVKERKAESFKII